VSSEAKRILLVTRGLFHPPYLARKALHTGLAQLEGFSFQHVASCDQIPADVDSFSALVLYYHADTISAAALRRLDAFVKNGGGILALHSATASYTQEKHYFEILGGEFTKHGKVESFEVRKTNPEGSEGGEDDIFEGIENFVVKDELYIHQLQPGVEIHFMAEQVEQAAPVVWTYRYGEGKVCYCSLGHTTASIKHPAVREILQRGLVWVAER
jgi:type 1 glutamine amidotransferase